MMTARRETMTMGDAKTKERPILMAGSMVRAVLAGKKTVTRRLVKTPPRHVAYSVPRDYGTWWGIDDPMIRGATHSIGRCPCGSAGERLYVRESYCPRYFDGGAHAYMADWTGEAAELVTEPKWTPSIHMPRAAARLLLDVTGVRVERLHDITDDDAKAEGVAPFFETFNCFMRTQRITTGELAADAEYRAGFAVLWDELYGDAGHLWISNPWVWRIAFARVVTAPIVAT